jgi:hypothetical protein
MEEPKPSLVKNLTGGGGCGCGCFGLLGVLLGAALLAAAPLGMYADPNDAPTTIAIVLVVLGLGGALTGGVVWLVSMLMD